MEKLVELRTTVRATDNFSAIELLPRLQNIVNQKLIKRYN